MPTQTCQNMPKHATALFMLVNAQNIISNSPSKRAAATVILRLDRVRSTRLPTARTVVIAACRRPAADSTIDHYDFWLFGSFGFSCTFSFSFSFLFFSFLFSSTFFFLSFGFLCKTTATHSPCKVVNSDLRKWAQLSMRAPFSQARQMARLWQAGCYGKRPMGCRPWTLLEARAQLVTKQEASDRFQIRVTGQLSTHQLPSQCIQITPKPSFWSKTRSLRKNQCSAGRKPDLRKWAVSALNGTRSQAPQTVKSGHMANAVLSKNNVQPQSWSARWLHR